LIAFLTQMPILLFFGARFDLLFGFNQTDAGWHLLLLLLLLVPILNILWFVTGMALLVSRVRNKNAAFSFWLPLIALFFLMEAVAIDIYLLSQMRM